MSHRLPPFALSEPESVDEAIRVLADGDTRPIAGGTALVPMLRLGVLRTERLVSLHRVIGLDRIEAVDGQLVLGAMTTIAGVMRAPPVREGWPLLAQAAERVASPAIRSTATIGGNLAYAEAASDVAPALLCLDAEVEVAGPGGARRVALAEFFRGFYETALEPGELITAVRVPAPPVKARAGYVKYCSRSAEDKPLVGVAALLALDGSGRATGVRVALAGAAPIPLRARRAEATLSGAPLSVEAIRATAEAAATEADPLSDLMGSAGYRREMIRVWVRRLLDALRDGRASALAELSRP
jgi:carbon-monoxide dehydrogenase medium subunit